MSAIGHVGDKSYRARSVVLTVEQVGQQIIENSKIVGTVQIAYDFWFNSNVTRQFARDVVTYIKAAGFEIEQ